MKIILCAFVFTVLLFNCTSEVKKTSVLEVESSTKIIYAEKNIYDLISLAPAQKRFRKHEFKPSVYLETGETLEEYLFVIEAGEIIEEGKNHATLIVETEKNTINFYLFEFNKKKDSWELIDSINNLSVELASLDVRFEDCTFDNLKDILIVNCYSFGGVGTHRLHLISLENEHLKIYPTFSEIPNPIPSVKKKVILSTRNIMCEETADWNICKGEWFWENKELKLKKEKCLCEEESQ